jgi:hypothetical protein
MTRVRAGSVEVTVLTPAMIEVSGKREHKRERQHGSDKGHAA